MPSVDERVVQMKFDNKQFESGVSQSEKTLERFKKSLDFKGVEDSIKNLENAVNGIDLSGLSNAVESIANKFSPLGILGVTAMQKIADAALDAGKKVADAFFGFSDMSAGQGKYETQTKAVQTITNATGKSVDDVEKVLAKLQKYTDETSYDFAEMVNSIGKFTSVGVELERAERAMEGIASEAAKSGAGKAEANRAMYNFAQALSAGYVKLIDWKSIENANMATKEFKETLIETAIEEGVLERKGQGVGTMLKQTSKGIKETNVDYRSFNETLSEEWLTSDVLIKTLEKYADTTTKFGLDAYHAAQEALTWSDALGAVQDAVSSGWMDSFKYMFGNLDEARVLWTDVANALVEYVDIFASWRNEILKSWHEMGGYNDLIEAASNLWQTFMNIVKGVGAALTNVFPTLAPENMTQALYDGTKALKEWSAGLLKMFGFYEEVKEDEEEVGKASGKTTIKMKKLQAIARGFGSAIKIVSNFAGAVAQVVGNVAGMFKPLIKDVLDFVYIFSGMLENLAEQLEKNGAYKKFFDDITNFFEPIANIVGNAHDAIHGFFKEYVEYLKTLDSKTPRTNDTFETFFSFLDEYLEKQGPFGQALKAGIQLVRSLFSVVSSVAQIVVKVGGMLFEIGKRVLTVLSPVWSMLSTIFQAGVGLFSAFAEKLGIFTKSFTESFSFTEWLKNLDENLPDIQKKVQDFCDTILGFLGLGDGIDSIDFSKTVDNIIDSIKKFLGLEIDTSTITDKIDTKGIVDTIKDKLIGVYTGIRDWITGLFKSDEVGAVKEGVMKLDGYKISIGVIGVAIALIAKQLYTVTNSFISIGNNVSKVIANVKGVTKEFKISKRVENIDTIAGALLKFAGTIGILAASVFVLAQLKWEQLIVGLTGLVAVMGLLIGSVLLLKKILKDADNIKDAIGALISLGIAIGALSGSVVALAALDWGGLARGLVGTAALLGACLLFFKLLDKMPLDISSTGGAIGLLTSLGAALNMLVGAVMTLSQLEPGKMIQGLLGVGSIMLGLFAFTKFLDKTKISLSTVASLFMAALAIDMLVGGFLIMTFAMKLLSIADIIKGIVGITAIVLEMAAFLKLIEKIHPSIGSILSLLPVAISLDLLIVGFSAMVLVMKHAKLGDVVKAFAGIGVLILGVAALLKLIEKIHPSVGSILALLPVAISLDLLIGGFIALTVALRNAGISDMIKAIASIGALVLSVALLTKLMEKAKPSIGAIFALIPIALALDLLVVGFIGLTMAMKSVTASTMIKSIISLAAMVIALGVVSKSIAKVNNGIQGIKAALTIIPLVLGLAGLAAIFAIFARSMQQVSVDALIKSIISIEVMVHAMGVLTSAMEDVDIKTAIEFFIAGGTLALLIYTFSKALERVKNLNGSKMLAFATALSELFIAFAIAGGIAGKLGAMNSFFGIIGIAAGIIAVIAAFSALMSIPAVEDFLTNGAEKLGKLVGSFIGAMKAAEFESFNKAIAEMTSIDAVDQSKVDNAIAAAQAVADFGAGLPSKSLISQAADFFFGSELKQFSGDMTAFGKGFNSFVREISSITISSGDLNAKTSSAIAIAESIKDFGESLQKKPITDKIVDAIFGSELKQFSFDMIAFGKGFNGFATQISEIDNYGDTSTKTTSAIAIAKSINEFGESLEKKPISQKITDAIFGSELSQFSSDMVRFGTGFDSYAKQIGLVDITTDLETKTASAISIANSIKEFGESLKEKTIDKTITDAIFGSELSQFSGDMVSFSTGFKGYVAQMNNLEDVGDLESKTGFAIRIADSIRQFSEALKEKTNSEKATDFFFGSELEQFSGDMVTFGTGYNSYAKEMAKIEDVGDLDTKTEYAIQIAGSISDFSNGLKEKSFAETVTDTLFGSELDQFSGDMTNFATKFNQFTSTMSTIKLSPLLKINVDTAVGIAGQIKALADGLSGKEIGTKITDAIFGSELSQFSGDMSTFASKFNTFATTMGSITADPEDVKSKNDVAISVAEKIASFLETVGGMNIETKHSGILGWFEKETTGETVFESLEKLGTAITGAKDDFAGVDASLLTSVNTGIEVVKAVGTLLAAFGEEGTPSKIGNGISSFSVIEQLFEDENFGLGAIIKRFSEQISSINNLPEISNIFAGFAGLIGNNQILLDGGSQIAETILEGFSSQFTQENEAFKTAGENLALGLAEGVEVKSEIAVKAVEVLAQSMLDKVISVFDSHSPSEETYAQGENFVDGLIKAVGDKGKELTDSVENLGNNALAGLTEVFGGGKEGEGLVDGLAKKFFGKGEDAIISIENVGDDLSDTLKKAFNGEMTGKEMIDDVTKGLFGDSSKTESEIDQYVNGVIDDIDNEIKNNAGSISLDDAIDYDKARKKTKKHIRLVYGDISEEVRQMQSDLMELGYNLDRFGADGIFGPETKAALNDFKRDYGLAVNGVFDTKASNKLAEALTESGSQIKYSEVGKTIYSNVESGLKSGADASDDSVATIILESLKTHTDKFVEQGKAFAKSLANGLITNNDKIQASSEILGKQIINGVKNTLKIVGIAPSKEAVELGTNFVLGLTEGIIFKAYLAQKAAEHAAELMKRAVENKLRINSPSKVGEQLGKYFVDGLVIGQNKKADDAKRASEDVSNSMLSVAKTTLTTLYSILDDGLDDYQPTIRPVLDLSYVKTGVDQMNSMISSKSNVLAATRSAYLASNIAASQHEGTRKKELDEAPRLKGFADSMDKVNEKLQGMVDEIKNMKIYMDGNTLVGYVSPRVNRTLGQQATLAGRMN